MLDARCFQLWNGGVVRCSVLLLRRTTGKQRNDTSLFDSSQIGFWVARGNIRPEVRGSCRREHRRMTSSFRGVVFYCGDSTAGNTKKCVPQCCMVLGRSYTAKDIWAKRVCWYNWAGALKSSSLAVRTGVGVGVGQVNQAQTDRQKQKLVDQVHIDMCAESTDAA